MKRIYLYKRIVLVGVFFAMIVISIGACGTNDTFDDSSWIKKYVVETIELEGDALEEYTSQGPELFWINRQFDKEYGSYNEALEQEIIDHERKGDSESLFRVCLVLNIRYRESAYWDRVNQFYSELMERMKSDSVLRKYINEEHRDYIDNYLETLKNKDMRDEYKEFFVSIDDYVIDANDVVMRVIMFLPKVDEVDIDDSRFFLQLMLDYEVRYCGKAWRQTDMFIYRFIAEFAENLGEAALAVEYGAKFEEVYVELSELE